MENNDYLINRAKEIQTQSNKVKENLDNINFLIMQKKKKLKQNDYYYFKIFNILLFLLIVFYYYIYKKQEQEQKFQQEKGIKKFLKKNIPFLINFLKSKFFLVYSMSNNLISIIIFQYNHIHKLQNIIKVLIND